MSEIICMWSGPRNLSTAMMRSFGSREDCAVIDEPFFAPFLAVSGKAHPGREETLERHETDPDIVAEICLSPPPGGEPLFFQKHMPHHMLPGFPMDWAARAKHFFLIREPARVIASYAKGREAFDLDDLGYAPQRRIYDLLTDMTGQDIPVIDSFDILTDPKSILSQLCERLEIEYSPAMLSWDAGARPEDGAWAPYWYKSVESSTGFGAPPTSTVVLSAENRAVEAACRADYDALHVQKLRV